MLKELQPGAVKATHDFCDQLGLPGVKDQTKEAFRDMSFKVRIFSHGNDIYLQDSGNEGTH